MAEPEEVEVFEVDPKKMLEIMDGMTEQERMEFSDALEGAAPGHLGEPIRDLVRRKEAESN